MLCKRLEGNANVKEAVRSVACTEDIDKVSHAAFAMHELLSGRH